MSNIFKIAAGVLIGLLLYQILMYHNMESNYVKMQSNMMEMQDLQNKYIRLTSAINRYYRENQEIPQYVSDLSCRDVYNDWKQSSCEFTQREGVFYALSGDEWISAEPYVFDNRVHVKCRTSAKLKASSLGENFSDCELQENASIPDRIRPTFSCEGELDDVQKLICSSDKLTALDNQLAVSYRELLANSSEDKKQAVEADRTGFLASRLRQCSTSICVEKFTENKLKRLKFLGVYDK